jgi:CDGSH-type Zn-finger protein
MKAIRKVKLISPTKGFAGLTVQKTGRNDLCWCGSGKKAKKCCGTKTGYRNREEIHSSLEVRKEKDLRHYYKP